ncbi:MAG: helix-turn-helix transcriptional regulator [Candidatus Dojkabacteria bacterium]
MMIYKEIGQKIKQLREEKGLSQQDLAFQLGYESGTAIHLIEKGDRKINIESLSKIANVFSIPIDFFIKRISRESILLNALRAENIEDNDIKMIQDIVDRLKKNNDRQTKN